MTRRRPLPSLLALALTLTLSGTVAAEDEAPTTHTLIYYNARMALREDRPQEAVRLWLLRNALENQTETVSAHDPDFHSVTWAALGALGVCPDGLDEDKDEAGGAGLWPLALHNWLVLNMSRRKPPRRPRTFDAFQLGTQQRIVAIGDVLGSQELDALRLLRGRCWRPRLTLVASGELITAKYSDRQVAARMMRYLLRRARETLADDGRIRGWATVEARLFDINLQLAALAAREARQNERSLAQRARELGLNRDSIEPMREAAAGYTFSPTSEPARILNASVDWPVEEWMALTPERRLFLFDSALDYTEEREKLDQTALGIIDTLIAEGDGAGAETWIAHRMPIDDSPAAQVAVWDGERGRRLLALDPESGFQERAVISLHRGVRHLERGELPEALRAMAYAMRHAPQSRAAGDVSDLSLRWLSYVASQFEITEDLLVTLQELIPRREYSIILEDLMWRAAFRADARSFQQGIDGQLGRGALERRLALLKPLARGDLRRFTIEIDEGLTERSSETLRFLDQLIQRLELEDADIRAAHIPTLSRLRRLLLPLSEDEGASGSQRRRADDLLGRIQAILEGLGGLGEDATTRDSARALSPDGEVFAGSVRLAPSDPLPWPFRHSPVPAPSVFSPLPLTPIEWRGEGGERVFGWKLGE